jgi:hypothetical protein
VAYATVAELRRILTQVAGGATNDALLQDALDDATSIVDGELGFSFAAYPEAAAASLYAVGGEPVETLIPVARERIKLAVANGGAGGVGTFHVYVG